MVARNHPVHHAEALGLPDRGGNLSAPATLTTSVLFAQQALRGTDLLAILPVALADAPGLTARLFPEIRLDSRLSLMTRMGVDQPQILRALCQSIRQAMGCGPEQPPAPDAPS